MYKYLHVLFEHEADHAPLGDAETPPWWTARWLLSTQSLLQCTESALTMIRGESFATRARKIVVTT